MTSNLALLVPVNEILDMDAMTPRKRPMVDAVRAQVPSLKPSEQHRLDDIAMLTLCRLRELGVSVDIRVVGSPAAASDRSPSLLDSQLNFRL